MRAMLPRMTAARKMTVEDWGELDDKDWRELVDGVLEEPEMASALHDTVIAWLIALLYPYFAKRKGFVASAGPRLVIRADRGRIADVMCWSAKHKPEMHGLVRTPPDVVVEIITPRPRDIRRDRIDKLADYAEMGCRQYWLVDPKLRTFEIWQLDSSGRYERVAAAARGKLRAPSHPGLVIDVGALWNEVDRLEAPRRKTSSA